MVEIKDFDYYSKFYLVRDPASKKSYRGNIKGNDGKFGKLLRGEYRTGHMEISHLEGGKEPNDLFWSHVNDPFCISEWVKNVLIEHNVTGLEFIPTVVRNKSNELSSTNFYAVIITGRVDKIDFLNSEIKIMKMHSTVKESAYFIGSRFDVNSWDSSDFFMERIDDDGKWSCHIFVTQKVVDLFKKNKIANILFENLADCATWCEMIKIGANDSVKLAIDERIKKASAVFENSNIK